ncbi:phospholipase D family protein [Pseudomonas aeruginosa]|uniref:phospholipase D family protein n=1 Tax=Pseudomonadota TaxID=1224 RepID=UPI0012A92342|nr:MULTISPECIES: phospholipase D family protein [Pseudomonadota]MBP8322348.1 phospholipase D family protein [Pseudomonas aeruginosa]CUR69134.1 putative HKD family nuclease [Achromobacter xylosoxidans]
MAELIATNKALEINLARLIESYPNIAFGVAWASSSTRLYDFLLENKNKIRAGVVGTHFYQTHPKVLEDFVQSQCVRFMLQPKGVFHPKLYLFWSEDNWEAVIGSANFTAGALGENTELSMLISGEDGDRFDELQEIVRRYAAAARIITEQEASNYRRIWQAKQPSLRKLMDQYGESQASKPAVDSHVMSLDWPSFLSEIQRSDKNHGFDERLALLDQIRNAFLSTPHFKDLDGQIRRAIAGIPNNAIENSAWFGSMKGAGIFKNRIISHPEHISAALDCIPLEGTVTKAQYENYIAEFVKAFPDGKDGVGTATRLLGMKRPDQFLCVDSANKRKLAEDIGIKGASKLDYDRYWDEVVERIMDAPWWKSSPPKSKNDLRAWKARAAMLDAIFYEPI